MSTSSPRGPPRRRPFFMQSGSTKTPTGHSPSSGPALDGPRSFTLAELSHPRFNPTPGPGRRRHQGRPPRRLASLAPRQPWYPRWRHRRSLVAGARPGGLHRQPVRHGRLVTRIWPAFDKYDLDSGCLRCDAESELQSRILEGAAISDESLSSSQKALLSMIEARAFSDFLSSVQVDVHRKAHLVLNRNRHGSHPFGTPPTRIFLLPFSAAVSGAGSVWQSGTLTQFAQTQDRWGDHALSCLCGGDRVGRHNAVRDVFHNIALGSSRGEAWPPAPSCSRRR